MASKKNIPATVPSETGDAHAHAPVAPPLDFITRLELFLEKRWRAVVAVLVIVVAAVVVYFYTKYKREDSMTASNSAVTAAATRSDLESVLKDYPGTVAAGTAMFQIADRQMKSSEGGAAGSTLEKFVADFPDHPLRSNALLGLGNISEKAGEYDKADGYFQQVVDGGGELAGLANLCQAELLVAKGELENAKEIYDAFGPANSGSPFVAKAVERAEALKLRIARKNAPTPPVEPEPEKPKPAVKPIEKLGPRVTPTPGAPNTEAAPEGETPAGETPAVGAPAVEAPAVEAPAVEAPAVEAPAVETPAVETPEVEAPEVEAPAE